MQMKRKKLLRRVHNCRSVKKFYKYEIFINLFLLIDDLIFFYDSELLFENSMERLIFSYIIYI